MDCGKCMVQRKNIFITTLPLTKLVPIKEVRKNIAHYADFAEKGITIVVIRRSEPSFKIVPLGEDDIETGEFEDFIDFTEGGKKRGIPATVLLKKMQEFEKKYG